MKQKFGTAGLMLVCGSIVLTLALGIRHSFGLFLQPVSADNGWGREVFSFAIALQNLLWGLTQPFTGMLADRYGAGRVVMVGSALYAVGLAIMASTSSVLVFTLALGVLCGIGMSSTTFNIILGALGRAYPPERRSSIAGIASAAGSFGQFAMLPVALVLISVIGWHSTLLVWVFVAAAMVPLGYGVRDIGYHGETVRGGIGMKEALAEACANKSFWLLSFGYFTCGFQIVFIGTHFPAFLLDKGLTARDGTIALALIGLFNIAGSFLAGWLGDRFSRPALLAGLYAIRGVLLAGILLLPTTPAVAYLFAALFGITWLGTVPLTNGVVAGMFGVRHLAMLGGIVFLFHQIGSFFGSWMGGYVFDAAGSYDIVWMIAIGLSVTATLLNLPIDERPVARMRAA